VAVREVPQEDGGDAGDHRKRPQERATKKRRQPQGAGGGSNGRRARPQGERRRDEPPFKMRGLEWRFIGRYWYALSRHWVRDPETGKKKRKRRYLGRLDK